MKSLPDILEVANRDVLDCILIPKKYLPTGYMGKNGKGSHRSLAKILAQCEKREASEALANCSAYERDKLAKSAKIDCMNNGGGAFNELFGEPRDVDSMLRQDAAYLEFAKLFNIRVDSDDVEE